ncbi:hypothetical protein [Actinacidiphila glaucinigra]|uniref:hypothetical protein n=1 Tax=Actinacidiphila glaucinigra TaxID=235986 RepID=UPI00366EF521
MNATQTEPGAGGCPDCQWEQWLPAPQAQPHYNHVHAAKVLPPARDADNHQVVHGYAVGMGGPRLPQLWMYFEDLAPAVVYGRAARMSPDVRGYGIYHAAREERVDWDAERRVITLHVTGRFLDRQAGEADILQEWIRGVVPKSAYFEDRPPAFL